MDAWSSSSANLASWGADYGLLALSVLLFIKAAGVPLPVPGDLLILLVGSLGAQGRMPLLTSLVVLSLATCGGALVLFGVMRHVGRGPVARHGHYLGLTPARLEGAQGYIRRRGWWAIAIGRVVPGLRLLSAVAAAIFDVHAITFASAAAAGAVVEVGICLFLGATLGPSLAQQLDEFSLPVDRLVLIVVFAVLVVSLLRGGYALRRLRTSRR